MALAQTFQHIDEEHSRRLTKMIMRLFEHWGLTYEEQSQLLGMSTRTNTSISNYKKGNRSIRFNRDNYDRVRYLLSIHKSLSTMFPHNKKLAYAWPKTPNKRFNGQTPVELIANDGFIGLVNVHNYLEHYMSH
jgi:hypothetical protein